MQLNGSIVQFRYLGDRDYLDVSQITEGCWSVVESCFRKEDLRDLHFRLLKPISTECVLSHEPHPTAKALLSFRHGDDRIQLHLLPTERRLTERVTEPDFPLEHYLDISPEAVRMKEKFIHPNAHVYLFMKMARAYVVKKYGSEKPRAVEFRCHRLIEAEESLHLQMKSFGKPRLGFLRLDASVGDEYLGYGFVTAL